MSHRPILVPLSGLLKDIAQVEEELNEDMPDEARNVHQTSKYLFYMRRPTFLENMCLAEFATAYSHSDRMMTNYQFSIEYVQQGNIKSRYFK